MHPLRGCCKDCESLARPETVGGAPGCDIGLELLCILVESVNVRFPLQVAFGGLNILKNDAPPLGVRYAVSDFLDCVLGIEVLNTEVFADLYILYELLVSLIVGVVEGTAIKTNNTRESVRVVDCSGCSYLGSKTVTTDSSHCDLVLIHKSHDVVRCVLRKFN